MEAAFWFVAKLSITMLAVALVSVAIIVVLFLAGWVSEEYWSKNKYIKAMLLTIVNVILIFMTMVCIVWVIRFSYWLLFGSFF